MPEEKAFISHELLNRLLQQDRNSQFLPVREISEYFCHRCGMKIAVESNDKFSQECNGR